MYRSNLREWYDDFKTYFHIAAVLVVLAIAYFMLSIDWGLEDDPVLVPVRSTANVFYQGSEHNLTSIVNNMDLLEERIIRIQLGRHAEETLLTIMPNGNIVPLEEELYDNRLILDMTLSTSMFWATPVYDRRGFIIGVYFEEMDYDMFLERWLLTGEYNWETDYGSAPDSDTQLY